MLKSPSSIFKINSSHFSNSVPLINVLVVYKFRRAKKKLGKEIYHMLLVGHIWTKNPKYSIGYFLNNHLTLAGQDLLNWLFLLGILGNLPYKTFLFNPTYNLLSKYIIPMKGHSESWVDLIMKTMEELLNNKWSLT